MSDLLARIDAATAGLCPCGAAPREDSAYCGPDCEPTHMAENTDPRMSGELATAMRWRPDLVTEADDTDLIPLGSNAYYSGRYNAQLFERCSRRDVWHLRLDDGHRFVGCDLEGVGDINDELIRRVGEKWAALERELGNTWHLVEDEIQWTDLGYTVEDPWSDVFPDVAVAQMVSGFGGVVHVGLRDGRVIFNPPASARDRTPRPSYHNPRPRAVDVPAASLEAAGRAVAQSIESMAPAAEAFLRESGFALTEWQRSVVEQMYRSTQGVRPRITGRTARWLPDAVWAAAIHRSALPAERLEVAGYRPAADPDEPPTDPMQRALWLRRRRNTGPAPDRLDGRRRRRR